MIPSGDVVTYTPGGAGRPLAAFNASNNFATSATYSPAGAPLSMTNGNTGTFSGIVTSNVYNSRQQPVLLSTGVPGQTAIFSLCYDFHLGQAINNPPCSLAASSGDNGTFFRSSTISIPLAARRFDMTLSTGSVRPIPLLQQAPTAGARPIQLTLGAI